MAEKGNSIMIATILIIVLIAFVVLGVLYGVFRSGGKLSDEEIGLISGIRSRAPVDLSALPAEYQNPQHVFSELWRDHVSKTREFILSDLHDRNDLKDREGALLKNQEDIGNAVDKYYPGSKNLVTNLFKEHIAMAKDIVEDLKHMRFGRIASDINKWYSNADEISEGLRIINPRWNMRKHMLEHLRITEREALYEWLGATKPSFDIYNSRIIRNAMEMADIMADGIVK